ncbi:hypothetical protein BP5796_06999 [Coleophoma crateriformis]|uniref:HlyIII-domain-containing protein n=1 Tax=Coleophoma crateriformis TaxID=565419 RepID=A0A3D8RQF3_9HELO|nr:hypothetical protein BP5796_06999 [Coleophoma crateriformis]
MASAIRQRYQHSAHTTLNTPILDYALDSGDKSLVESESVLKTAVRQLLISWEDLPDWAKDNEYMHSGFRPISNSYSECFKSLGYLHNETGNIYSHLLATIWMFGLAAWRGGLFCIIYGLPHFHKSFSLYACLLPQAGLSGYHYRDEWLLSAGTMLDLAAQLSGAIFVLSIRKFRTPAWRPIRGLLFSFMASSAFYPIIIAICQVGWKRANIEYGASSYMLTIIIYLISVTIYAIRFPEAWKPGQFDIWGQSHQLFHIGMVIGLTIHFGAFMTAVDQFYSVKDGVC